ncbi:MAG: hypothetical protein AAFR98_10910 [Pseudomonadota bacterium]
MSNKEVKLVHLYRWRTDPTLVNSLVECKTAWPEDAAIEVHTKDWLLDPRAIVATDAEIASELDEAVNDATCAKDLDGALLMLVRQKIERSIKGAK